MSNQMPWMKAYKVKIKIKQKQNKKKQAMGVTRKYYKKFLVSETLQI